MEENKSKQLPRFDSLDQLVEFFDNNDLGDYLDSLPEVEFQVNIKHRQRLVALDEDVAVKVEKIAQARHTSSQALVNDWLREKVIQVG